MRARFFSTSLPIAPARDPAFPALPQELHGARNGRGATLKRLKSGTTQVGSHFCGAQVGKRPKPVQLAATCLPSPDGHSAYLARRPWDRGDLEDLLDQPLGGKQDEKRLLRNRVGAHRRSAEAILS
jgi:hypothetical protein